MTEFKDYLAKRRSTPFPFMSDIAPNESELAAILVRAARVPDHGKLFPWRFIIITRHEGVAIGEKLVTYLRQDGEADEKRLSIEAQRFTRAPLCVAIVSTSAPHVKIPEWEQVLSAGALGMNLLHAAHAYGFGGNWVTEWMAYDARVAALFKLSAHEKFAGFVHIGKATAVAEDRPRPDMAAITTYFGDL